MFAQASKKANVKATFHALRHTFAATMLRALQRQSTRAPHASLARSEAKLAAPASLRLQANDSDGARVKLQKWTWVHCAHQEALIDASPFWHLSG
jgi:integrase